jgi:hypothetical protein
MLFVAVTALATVIVVELVSLAALWILEGRPVLPGDLQAERAVIAGDAPRNAVDGESPGNDLDAWNVDMAEVHVLHPYLGFVQDPDRDPAATRWSLDRQAASLGFPRNFHPPFDKPSPDAVTVVVIGGSVARQIGFGGNRPLEEGIARIPRFQGRDVRVLAFGLGGYKQPQQLMTFSYLLALGVPIDVVVNIDGFNELVLPITENIPLGVNPAYPREWAFRVEALDPEERVLHGEISLLRKRRQGVARLFSLPILRHSAAAALVWRLADWLAVGAVNRREVALADMASRGGSYQTKGPTTHLGDGPQLYEALVDLWYRSSLQTGRLAAADGIEYYHFLQPNQYDVGSKTLTQEERRQAWDDDAPARTPVTVGYPLLRARGRLLRDAGIDFVDLSQAFREIHETVYIDRCCHYNDLGIRTVVEHIVRAIAQSSDGAPAVHSQAAPPP